MQGNEEKHSYFKKQEREENGVGGTRQRLLAEMRALESQTRPSTSSSSTQPMNIREELMRAETHGAKCEARKSNRRCSGRTQRKQCR